LSRNSSRLNRQNELIRSLRRQLEATERDLADQKWLFQQFLNAPSWRLTYPVRWLAKLLRTLHAWFTGTSERVPETEKFDAAAETSVSAEAVPEAEPETGETEQEVFDAKHFFTDFYRIQLRSLLASNTPLELPHSQDPEISIILVLFNRAEMTLGCLRSLAENRSVRMEVIIVDNASRDETGLLLDRLTHARIIRNSENRHFLEGVNQAARAARGEYLLLLNNDTQVLPGTLQSAIDTIHTAPDIGAVGGRLILLDGTLQEAGSIIWRDGSCLGYGRGDNPFAPMYMFRRDVDYCSGAFLLTPRAVWERLGGFDETFKPAYYEETDYCTRLWEHRLRVVYDPNSVVLHYEFASSASVAHAIDLQRDHQRLFAARHQNLLAKHATPDLNSILAARMKDRDKRRVLFIDDRPPHTWLGSGFPRSRALLLTLLKHDSFVTLYPFARFDEEWSSVYSDIPPEIEVMIGYGPLLIEPFLRSRAGYYDTIFISRPHNMKILKPVLEAHPEWFEQTDIVYDAEAIFATREIGLRALTQTPLLPEQADALLREEVELASVADCVIGVSGLETEQFRRHGIENVRVVGHSLEVNPTPKRFSERTGFLFVGAIHEELSPNGDSVIWFLEEVFPKIQAALGFDIPFTVAGVNNSGRVTQLAGPSVRITGHLPDLTELYNTARVFVAPTRYAAGIPHKVHEAAARGLPTVATPLLASQLGWQDESAMRIAGDGDSFAEQCIALYKDERLWSNLRQAGLERIRSECSKENFEARLMNALAAQNSRRCGRNAKTQGALRL
jgi:O-antigen biosynthesis protein